MISSECAKVTYVANAGILVTIGEKKVLIDGLFSNDEDGVFQAMPKSTCRQIIDRQPPFDGLELILITHDHYDHFSAANTVRFLRQNPEAAIVSNAAAAQRIKAKLDEGEEYDIITVEPPKGSGVELALRGFEFSVYSLRHDGAQFGDVTNLAFLIKDRVKIMHVGDALASVGNFQNLGLADLGLDLLVAPFPYVGLPRSRKNIASYINPAQILGIHLPDEAKDGEGWISATMKNYERIRDDFYPVRFFRESGEVLLLPC